MRSFLRKAAIGIRWETKKRGIILPDHSRNQDVKMNIRIYEDSNITLSTQLVNVKEARNNVTSNIYFCPSSTFVTKILMSLRESSFQMLATLQVYDS